MFSLNPDVMLLTTCSNISSPMNVLEVAIDYFIN